MPYKRILTSMLPQATPTSEGIMMVPDVRVKRQSDLHLYVDPVNGNDNNNGQTASTALATFIGLRVMLGRWDGNGYALYIHLAAATFIGGFQVNSERLVGFSNVGIIGAGIGQTIFDGQTAKILTGIELNLNATFSVEGITFKNCAIGVRLLFGYSSLGNLEFIDCKQAIFLANGFIYHKNNIRIQGNFTQFIFLTSQSSFYSVSSFTFANPTIYADCMFHIEVNSSVNISRVTITGGTFTGDKACSLDRSYMIGADKLPGNGSFNDKFAATPEEAIAGTSSEVFISPSTFDNAFSGNIQYLYTNLTSLNQYENPVGSGLYPSLAGKVIILKDSGELTANKEFIHSTLILPDKTGALNIVNNKLFGGTNLYFRKDGNDSNDGSANTPDKALLSVNRAWKSVNTLVARGYGVTLNLGPGEWGVINIDGKAITNIISIASSDVNDKAKVAITAINRAIVNLYNVCIYTPLSYWALDAQYQSVINIYNSIDFSGNRNGYGMLVSGRWGSHINFMNGIKILFKDLTVIEAGFFVDNMSLMDISGNTITSTQEGTVNVSRKFSITNLSIINTNGKPKTFFPGTAEGNIEKGGLYV